MSDERRRQPRQKRSKATHDAIVEAAARVFAEVGLEKATTARIAELAGVSPGSMYQYFPSKSAIVTALFERESDVHHRAFLGLAAEHGVDDVPRLVRAFVEFTVRAIEDNRALYHVLIDEVPRVSGLSPSREIDERATKSLRLLLELAKARLACSDLDAAAVLVVRTFRYTTIPLVYAPLSGVARESFIDELTDMLSAYLLAPRPWREERSLRGRDTLHR